jgi:cell division protein FtsX
LQWARAELPDPVDAPLPAPEVVAVDSANFDQIDQMLTAIKEQDNDPWVARSYRFSTRGQKIALGLGIGVGLVVLVMVASFVVGYFLG